MATGSEASRGLKPFAAAPRPEPMHGASSHPSPRNVASLRSRNQARFSCLISDSSLLLTAERRFAPTTVRYRRISVRYESEQVSAFIGIRRLGWDGLVCNGPNGARGDSPGQGPGVPRRIMGALKGRNGVWTVGRCEPGGIAGACGARAAGSEIRPYLKGALWRRGRIGEGGIPPLQGGTRLTGRTQGFALGYCIRPRWGRNSRGVRRGAARSGGPSANPWIPGAVSGWIGAT